MCFLVWNPMWFF